MKIIVPLFISLATSFAAAAPNDALMRDPKSLTTAELDAMTLLQATSSDLYFEAGAVAKLAAEITYIQSSDPMIKDIHSAGARPESFSTVLVNPSPFALTALQPLIEKAAGLPAVLPRYQTGGIELRPLLDPASDLAKLSEALPISSMHAYYAAGPQVPFHILFILIETKLAINPMTLMRSPFVGKEIASLSPNLMFGGNTRINRKVVNVSTIEYTFAIGSGDCPAGCIDWESHRYELNQVTGQIVKIGVERR